MDYFATLPASMTLFGLQVPRLTHRDAVRKVLSALAVVIGFALGAWMTGTPLDREGAAGLFVGFLYILLADPFLAMGDARVKRFAIAACGAGLLVGGVAAVQLWP